METPRNRKQGAMESPVQALWGRKYVPPAAAEAAAARGPQPFPRMMYHPDGRMQVAQSKDDHEQAVENGWRETPELSHREMLQTGDGGKSGKRMPTAGSAETAGPVHGMEQPKWGMAAIANTTKVTDHHVKFLQSRGYSVADIKDVEKFIRNLTTEEAAGFFADSSEWKA